MTKIVGFSGALLVTRGGEPVLQESDGVADAGTGTPCTTDTRFQIASLSKQFTAAAVLLLVEAGEVSLYHPVAHWLPDYLPDKRQLTLHQLLSHTSGLGHWDDLPGFDVHQPGDRHALLRLLSITPLRTAPGTTWHDSSPGYLLAAQVIERVSGQTYADFLTEQVLRPLGMTSTCVGEAPETAAHGYRENQRVDVPELAALPGTGDLWSTVGDLARYTAAFNAGDLLTTGSRAMMVAPHASMDTRGADGPAVGHSYGYGYFLGTLTGQVARFLGGDAPGYRSFLAWLPGPDVTVAILCNNEETDVDDLLRQVLPAVLDS